MLSPGVAGTLRRGRFLASALQPRSLCVIMMDKALLVSQLTAKLKATTQQAHRFADDARTEAKTGAPRAVNLGRRPPSSGTKMRSGHWRR